MNFSVKTQGNPLLIKDAVLNLLADKLNCGRHEVSFLFGKNISEPRSEIIEIPDVRPQ